MDSRSPISLLVVEDDKVTREIVVYCIARKYPGVSLNMAADGNAGLELFREHIPDIVITDINMPGMDGIRMAEEIRSIKAETRFIVITGHGDKNYMEKFCEIGFCEYIMKPIMIRDLLAVIEKCIDTIRSDRE